MRALLAFLSILVMGCDASAEAGAQTTLAFAAILIPTVRLLAIRENS
ncbi:MAG TPA: hypothetical protein VIU61_01005 [Kofleriaceae bacterium]